MEAADIYKLFGLIIGIIGAMLTIVRMLNNRLSEVKTEVNADMKNSNDRLNEVKEDIKELHSRISTIKEDYVRRDDHDKRYEQIEKLLDGLTTKMDRLIERK